MSDDGLESAHDGPAHDGSGERVDRTARALLPRTVGHVDELLGELEFPDFRAGYDAMI